MGTNTWHNGTNYLFRYAFFCYNLLYIEKERDSNGQLKNPHKTEQLKT